MEILETRGITKVNLFNRITLDLLVHGLTLNCLNLLRQIPSRICMSEFHLHINADTDNHVCVQIYMCIYVLDREWYGDTRAQLSHGRSTVTDQLHSVELRVLLNKRSSQSHLLDVSTKRLHAIFYHSPIFYSPTLSVLSWRLTVFPLIYLHPFFQLIFHFRINKFMVFLLVYIK